MASGAPPLSMSEMPAAMNGSADATPETIFRLGRRERAKKLCDVAGARAE